MFEICDEKLYNIGMKIRIFC